MCIFIAGCVGSEVKKNTTNPLAPSKDAITIKYFTIKNCSLCDKTDTLLLNLSTQYPGKFTVVRYDLTNNKTNRDEFLQYTREMKIKTVPFMVINERNIFSNYTMIVNNLEPSIKGSKRLI